MYSRSNLDELYAVLRDVKDGTLGEDEALKRLERSPCWVWTAIDPETQLLVIDVGTRTMTMAQRSSIRSSTCWRQTVDR